jgi:hypothetical protein
MKSTLLLLVCLVTGLMHGPSDIYGKWRLEKLVTKTKTVLPNEVEYFLTVSEKSLSFNWENNTCLQGIVSMDDSILNLSAAACTKIAIHDSIAVYLDYSGKYKLNNSQLTITNSKGTFYLHRETE